MEGQGHGTAQLNFNFTRLSKALAGVLCLGYAVQLIFPTAREYLTLVPGRCAGVSSGHTAPDHTCEASMCCRTIPCVWNVFTAGLVETDIFRVSRWLLSGCTCTCNFC